MGKDIHMYLIKENEVLDRDLYTGRNYRWFDNISGRGGDLEYEDFPFQLKQDFPLPDEIISEYQKFCGYGLACFKVKDFLDWYTRRKPYLQAGWVTTYEKWLWETKMITPDAKKFLNPEDIIEDMHFIEYTEADSSTYLYEYLIDVDRDTIIVYWFDC